MKSEVKIVPLTLVYHSLPALYKTTTSTGLVVLATSANRGVVVQGDAYNKVGDTDREWVDFDDDNRWIRLPVGSTVTLTQE